jgi:hypothetical protein
LTALSESRHFLLKWVPSGKGAGGKLSILEYRYECVCRARTKNKEAFSEIVFVKNKRETSAFTNSGHSFAGNSVKRRGRTQNQLATTAAAKTV